MKINPTHIWHAVTHIAHTIAVRICLICVCINGTVIAGISYGITIGVAIEGVCAICHFIGVQDAVIVIIGIGIVTSAIAVSISMFTGIQREVVGTIQHAVIVVVGVCVVPATISIRIYELKLGFELVQRGPIEDHLGKGNTRD